MQRLISAVFAFLILGLVAGFALFRWSLPLESASLYTDRPAVPFVMLAFGLPVAVWGYWLVHRFLTFVPAEDAAFPRFVVTEFETAELDRLWQGHSVLVLCLLPLAGFCWAWWELCTEAQAWVRVMPDQSVNLWLTSEACPLTDDWNRCRLGADGKGGVSFVPFWHSVVWCGGLSVIVAAQIGAALWRYGLRRRTRPAKRRVALSARGR